ncbi:MAG: hypothetical protein ICV60_03075 [Pyrinomonadaceae bacterium]|nr:hypothetical protein [Pyrinomonadaceae bacterium]
MIFFALERHLIWSRPNGNGGVTTLYYYDEITWVVTALLLAWLTWLLVRRYRRSLALRRPRRRTDYGLLKRIIKLKDELSSRYLRLGFSANIHAIGIGRTDDDSAYCIQVFVSDANQELWPGAGAATLPASYGGVPLVLIETAPAIFLSDADFSSLAASEHYSNGIRGPQEVIIGGISGANTNLSGQSGTIGYFCTRKSRWSRRKEIHLLSNSHVFADLRKTTVDASDLIMQPSPGEPASNRPIAALVNFSALRFDADIKEPNHVDAAIAKLWDTHRHKGVIPLIGAVKGYVPKKEIQVGEAARKFGRTTGYTEGSVFSIYLDIWIRYDRTAQSAFFKNQVLIKPRLPEFTKFVSKGDSGSLVVDAEQHALGLIFAGTPDPPKPSQVSPDTTPENDAATDNLKRIESYGVANPISDVLERLNIELLEA